MSHTTENSTDFASGKSVRRIVSALAVVALAFSAIASGGESNARVAREGSVHLVSFDQDALRGVQVADGPITVAQVALNDALVVDLTLERFHITRPDTRFVVGRRDGRDQVLDFDASRVSLFRGRVAGYPDSHVFVSISDFATGGSIDLGPGLERFGVSSRSVSGDPLANGQISVFRLTPYGGSGLPVPFCGVASDATVALNTSVRAQSAAFGGGAAILDMQQIELAIETDYEFFTLFGDLDAAAAYVVAMYGAVSDIYIRDVNTRFDLTFVRLWDDPDDLFNEPEPLGPFRDYWEANMGEVHRDVAQFFTGRRDLPWGGIAWLEGLCNDFSYSVAAYALGFFADPSTPSVFNRDITVTAHELGHSCAAPHTHDLGLDTCNDENSDAQRGTIMSYCGQTFTGGGANTDPRLHSVIQVIMENFIFTRECVVTDCNQNGIDDSLDIQNGTSPDTNANGVPDDCEDCNTNGVLDDQDILAGTSDDLNDNGVPDECEPDCNDNGLPDDLDFEGQVETVFSDNFETDLGWTVENLGATTGDWERGVPVNDPGWAHDPVSDSDGSGSCFLTENQLGNTDVDDGATRLTSPQLDLSEGGLGIGYDYFLKLTGADGTDKIVVEADDNDGLGPWSVVAVHDTNGGLEWRSHFVDADALAAAGIAANEVVRVRFTINDDDPQTIVEGGIDAFYVGNFSPALSEDLNFNNIPDDCEPDCNDDGVMDYLEIQADMSLDLNRNILLDACEDCDGDLTPDLVELDHANNVWIASLDHTTIREYLALVGPLTGISDDAGIGEGQDVLITADRRVLVTSRLDNRVVEFNVDGNFAGNLVEPGDGGLSAPAAMTIKPDGNLLVVSRGTNGVLEYNSILGTFVGEFVASGDGGLVAPFGLAFGPSGNLFVTSNDGRVLEYDGTSGVFVGVFVSAADNGGLIEPRGIIFLPTTGNLLVASYGTNQALEYHADTGAFVRQFNQGGTEDRLTLDQPWTIRLGPDGDVYISRNNAEGNGDQAAPLHLTNARIYHFDVDSGFFMRAYILAVNSGILHPTGFDFVPAVGLDCNFNLMPDLCDIASGASNDINENDTPDECESLGDMDGDADVDLDDYAQFFQCITGPDGGPVAPGCENADIDGDGDVDFADFALFVLTFTG